MNVFILMLAVTACYTITSLSDKYAVAEAKFTGNEFTSAFKEESGGCFKSNSGTNPQCHWNAVRKRNNFNKSCKLFFHSAHDTCNVIHNQSDT